MSGMNGRSGIDDLSQGRAGLWTDGAAIALGGRGPGRDRRRFRGVIAVRAASALIAATACAPASASPVDGAARSPALAAKLAEFRQACSDERIDAATTPVRVAPGAMAVLVKLTSSKGQCFGQPGENDYLMVDGASGWRSVLTAEPGSIRVGKPDAKGFAAVTLYGLGLCKITYNRVGSGYRATPTKDCHGLGGAPSLLDVTGKVRR